ncbi:MAG: TIGR03790 family protein [Phycisphaeraceae bacterium]|nr:TIGR03790 family protein [Phycisphaeraceae bacterium]
MKISRTTVAPFAFVLCAHACAGPEQLVLIADPQDTTSMYLANVYMHERDVPASNFIAMHPGAANHLAFSQQNAPAFLGTIASRNIDDHADFVLVAPSSQFRFPVSSTITDSCSPVNNLSISSAYTLIPVQSEVLGGQPVSTPNRYFLPTGTMLPAFHSNINWLAGQPSTNTNARMYFLGTMLGYTGTNGNTPAELVDMIERSAASDGTRPSGTFYFMNNQADPARNVRFGQFGSVATQMNSIGAVTQIINGIMPNGQHDILGVMTGNATLDFSNMTILPGAFCDHLTSFAATFSTSSQTKVSAWIANGASASAGAIEEPCNYTGKFPRADIHKFYFSGATIGEAWFRTMQYQPYQLTFYGDPLTRTFAHIPSISVPNAPTSTVSGTVTLSPQGTTTHPSATVSAFRAFVDGVLMDEAGATQNLTIDTTQIADGWHELRVVGYDDTPMETSGTWIGSLTVNNNGMSATLNVPTTIGSMETDLDFIMQAPGSTVTQVRLLHGDRVVASAQGNGGTVQLRAQMLGAGKPTVQAEAVYASGQRVRSAPVQLDIDFDNATASAAPIAFDYAKFVSVDHAAVVELPASVATDLSSASWQLLGLPAQSSVLLNDGSPYFMIEPNAGASGFDDVPFKVTTSAGDSNTAIVRIIYEDVVCYADCDGSGTLNIFDYICFGNQYAAGDPYADCDGSGTLNIFDYICFGNEYAAGCP